MAYYKITSVPIKCQLNKILSNLTLLSSPSPSLSLSASSPTPTMSSSFSLSLSWVHENLLNHILQFLSCDWIPISFSLPHLTTPPPAAPAQTLLYLTHQNLQFHNLTSPYRIRKTSILNKPICNLWLHCKHHTQTLKPLLLSVQAPIKLHVLSPLASPIQAHVIWPIVINLELRHKDHQWERQSWNTHKAINEPNWSWTTRAWFDKKLVYVCLFINKPSLSLSFRIV